MALGFTTMQPPSRLAPTPGGGWWGQYIIDPAEAQWYVPPAPRNTTKYHLLPSDCGTTCFPGMPPACADPTPVTSGRAAALADGGNFSCGQVPVPAPPQNATRLRAGQVVEAAWSLELGEGQGVAPFVLETGNPGLDHNLALFADVYNMWAGNIFGNSPASIVCLHEVSMPTAC